jgi:acetate CoA/acetoacetate CoA-transferase beta subunit
VVDSLIGNQRGAKEPQTIIARRIAQELKADVLVNLGIGIPRWLRTTILDGLEVIFQSEIGLRICC